MNSYNINVVINDKVHTDKIIKLKLKIYVLGRKINVSSQGRGR